MPHRRPRSPSFAAASTPVRVRALVRGMVFAAALPAALALGGCTLVGDSSDEFESPDAPARVVSPTEIATRVIDARDVDRHIAFLASDDRRGRGTPGPGLERTAAWIATAFHEAGIEPAGDSSGYLQYWPYQGRGAPADSAVLVPNVVGWVPGSELTRAGEYVIVVAHYDHVGVGTPDESGDSIYNGADDNASGVAALVEVAQAFGALPTPPARPVILLAVSGEERGLLGSHWFAENRSDLNGAVAVLNMDMVGRNAPDSLGLVGYEYSTLGPLIEELADAEMSDGRSLGFSIVRDLAPGQNLFRRSDHWPFAHAGVPAIAISSGLHEDYHAPSDEADLVNDEKVARVARLVFLTAHRLATTELRPEWTAAGQAAIQ